MSRRRFYYFLAGLLAFVLLVNLLFYFYNAEQIVSLVGVKNTYLVVFIISAIGGLSTFTGAVVITSIATFAAGGASQLGLALAGGLGIFISDSVFYFLVLFGRRAIPPEWERKIEKIGKWMERHPPWAVLAATYVYISFSPFPNDLLMLGLVIGGYSYRRIVWVLLAGSFTVAMFIAYLGNVILN